MNEPALFDKAMTTRELAESLNTSPKVILENAKKCLPDKVIENGKPTYWTKAEITILLEQLKSSNQNQYTFTEAVKVVSTELTPALKIKKAFDLMNEGYQEEIARLKSINKAQAQKLVEQQPKVESYNRFLSREKFCNFTDAANYLNIKRHELIKLLNTKYIYKNSVGEYRAYSNYSRYFALRPFEKGSVVGQQLMFTIEGLDYFKEKLHKIEGR